MTSKNINEKRITNLYGSLPHMERLNLTLSALARGDKDDVEAIMASCQTKHYVAKDLDYKALITSLTLVMNHLTLTHVSLHGDLQFFTMGKIACMMVCAYEDGLAVLGRCKNKKSEERAARFSNLADMYENKAQQLTTKLKALHEGFQAFCTEVGMDHKSALTCLAQSVTPRNFPELQEQDAGAASLDTAAINEIKNKFLELWE